MVGNLGWSYMIKSWLVIMINNASEVVAQDLLGNDHSPLVSHLVEQFHVGKL